LWLAEMQTNYEQLDTLSSPVNRAPAFKQFLIHSTTSKMSKHLKLKLLRKKPVKEEIWFNQQSHHVLSHHQQTVTELKSHAFWVVIPC
jgi:hypothetical protein